MYFDAPNDYNFELFYLIACAEYNDSRLTYNQQKAANLLADVWEWYIKTFTK